MVGCTNERRTACTSFPATVKATQQPPFLGFRTFPTYTVIPPTGSHTQVHPQCVRAAQTTYDDHSTPQQECTASRPQELASTSPHRDGYLSPQDRGESTPTAPVKGEDKSVPSPDDRGEWTQMQLSGGQRRDGFGSEHCDGCSTEKPRAGGPEHPDGSLLVSRIGSTKRRRKHKSVSTVQPTCVSSSPVLPATSGNDYTDKFSERNAGRLFGYSRITKFLDTSETRWFSRTEKRQLGYTGLKKWNIFAFVRGTAVLGTRSEAVDVEISDCRSHRVTSLRHGNYTMSRANLARRLSLWMISRTTYNYSSTPLCSAAHPDEPAATTHEDSQSVLRNGLPRTGPVHIDG